MGSTLDLIVIALYMAIMLGIGFWARRRATDQEEFLVAGRTIGPLLYAGTLGAIVIGGGSTVGSVRLGYETGISGMWFVSMYGFGMIVVGVFLVPRILKLKLYTIPEILARRYGTTARIGGGLIMAAYDFMIVVTMTIAAGAVMQGSLGIPRTVSILIASGVMIAYSVMGGMWALTATDIVQFVIKTVGIFAVLLPAAIIHAGGWTGMHAKLPADFFSLGRIGAAKLTAYVTLYFLGILIAQDSWQRVFTARTVSIARWGGVLVGCYCIAFAAACAVIGAAGRSFLSPLSDTDGAFAAVLNVVLPDGLRGLVIAASLSAIMSTATAGLLATSTVLLEDVYFPIRRVHSYGTMRQSRILLFVLGLLCATTSCLTHDVIAALTIGYDLLVGAMFVPVIGAILWSGGTSLAAILAIVGGAVGVVVMLFVDGLESYRPIYCGLALSTTLYFGVSFGSPSTRKA
jgi:SSS family solute:Na+ symporter